MKLLGNLLLLGMLSASVVACSSAEEDLCDLRCECEYCTPGQYDNCVYSYEDRERQADFRGCIDLYDMWVDCRESTAYCAPGRDFEDACGFERSRLNDCIN